MNGNYPQQMHGPFKKFGKWIKKGVVKTGDAIAEGAEEVGDWFKDTAKKSQKAQKLIDDSQIDQTKYKNRPMGPTGPEDYQPSGPIDPAAFTRFRAGGKNRFSKLKPEPRKFKPVINPSDLISRREMIIRGWKNWDPTKDTWEFGEPEYQTWFQKNIGAIASGAAVYRIFTGGGL